MNALAWRSLRYRRAAFTATFLAVALGTALMGSFATLIETAGGPVSASDAESLRIMGAVVGSWGAVIVLFSVVSTVGITVRQRAAEIGLLRTIGGTPRQARRLLRTEVLLVTSIAAAGGALLASLGGHALLALLRGTVVADDVPYGASAASPALTAAGVVVLSMIAATAAGRRATRGSATLVVVQARDESRTRLRWWRLGAAMLLLAYGVGTAVVTITVTAHSDDPYAAMQTSGSSAILVGVGMALLAPVLLRSGSMLLGPLLGRGARRTWPGPTRTAGPRYSPVCWAR